MSTEITDWLRALGLEQYAARFHDNAIDAEVLRELTADDLKDLGVDLVGHRRKLLAAIAALRNNGPGSAAPSALTETAPPEQAAGIGTGAAERRQLTVMFCDLVGSTELSARLDPEDLRTVIAAYHRAAAAMLTRFEGFVAKYMGDGILAYFGYPQAHEDDAERAVRAALAIVDAVGRLDLPQRLQVRIGIATGLAVVGDLIGAGAAQEQSVIGETPNLAARLQALAEPDAIVIAEGTRRQIGGLFDMRDLGPQTLKGFAGAQRAWQVVCDSGVASRFEALRSGEMPLVGRDEELELMLRRWNQAKAGEGRVVLLSGEPGIGKSRLTEALQQRIAAEPSARQHYFCSPHRRDSALFPIIGELERAARIGRDDDVAAKQAKLAALATAAALSDEDLLLLAELLSLPVAKDASTSTLSAQRKKERTLEALLRRLERLARRQPALLIVEDLHWIDPTSRELLDHLIAAVAGLPVLLIATFRPEFQPPWIGQPHVTMLSLARLGRREGTALVRQLLAHSALPPETVQEIVERTDGVPLFLEEVTKVVIEAAAASDAAGAPSASAGLSGAKIAVPATLRASLMARLDRLGPAAREVAQIGAAIGREFSYALLAVVAQRSEPETRAALDSLVAAGLVFRRGLPPAFDCQFKHALVQDTAYESLLRGPRQALHARIADALLPSSADKPAAAPEIIAHHLQNAGRSTEAIVYWRKAGEQALRSAANREAVGHLRRALSLLAALPETDERWRTELAILSQLGPALMSVLGWSAAEVGEVVERAAEVGRRLESSRDIAPAIANLWIFNVARGRLDRAGDISDDLFRIARAIDDPEVMLQAHHSAWATKYFLGMFAQSGAHLDAAHKIYDEKAHAHHRHVYLGHDPGVCLLNFSASLQFVLGHLERGARFERDGINLARRLQHAPSLANSLWRACEILHFPRRSRDSRYDGAGAAELDRCARASVASRQRHDFPRLVAGPLRRNRARDRTDRAGIRGIGEDGRANSDNLLSRSVRRKPVGGGAPFRRVGASGPRARHCRAKRRAMVRCAAAPSARRAAIASPWARRQGRRGELAASNYGRAATGRQDLGTCRRREPSPIMGRTRPAQRGARAAGRHLWLVHRRIRRPPSEESEAPAR